jgi:hypothetical protein
MGDDIETGRSMSSDYWAALRYVEQKSKQTAIDDRPEPMSSPINNPAYFAHINLICVYLFLYASCS